MKKSNQKVRILHLEDSPTDAELIAYLLKKSTIEFEIKVVDSKTMFELAIKEFIPDVVISDHSLLCFNSMEALRILKDSGLQIPFILVTGFISEDFVISMLNSGIDDYIHKDKELHRLPASILSAIEKSHSKKKAEKEKITDHRA